MIASFLAALLIAGAPSAPSGRRRRRRRVAADEAQDTEDALQAGHCAHRQGRLGDAAERRSRRSRRLKGDRADAALYWRGLRPLQAVVARRVEVIAALKSRLSRKPLGEGCAARSNSKSGRPAARRRRSSPRPGSDES